MSKKIFFIDGFILKLIAFALMTFDHIGIFMMGSSNLDMYHLGEIFRILGRFAFPLFILMLVEGVRYTHSYAKYALRLGVVATAILVVQIIITYNYDSSVGYANSPLIDLLCCGTFLYLINRKDKWSLLAIIPFILVVGSFIVCAIENSQGIAIKWFPYYLRSGYSIFGLIMAVMMFYSLPFLKKLYEYYHMDENGYEDSFRFRFSLNIAYGFAIFVGVVVLYLLAKLPGCDVIGIYREGFSQTWALLAIPIVMFYNGRRGYNAKWFQYASYLYFPLHLVIIYLIFSLI